MRQYELATSQLDELQRQQRASMGRPDSTLECALAEAHASCEALRSLVETADKAPPAPSAAKFPAFKSLVRAIPRGHVVISINILNRGTAVVCVGRSDAGKIWTSTRLESALDGAHLQELVLGNVEALPRASSPDDIPDAPLGWAAGTRNKTPELWQRTLRHVVKELGARLWPMIESAIEGRTRRLILMPGAGFAVLPLHAGLLANGMRAQDCFEIRYAPSLSLFQRASRLAPVRLPHSLGQLIPLSPDLPFAALQAVRVLRHLGGTQQARVEGLKATPDAALALLASPGIFHFTGNGAFNSNQPLRSELVCAGEGGDGQGLLTVRMMLERAEQLRCNLAILPGCESGRVEPADLMHDSLGLPGALLAAGCGGVLATFWPVRDLVASLVLDHTLETWRAGSVTLPGALARATRWLRDATTEKVCERLAVWREDNPEFAPLLDTTMDELRQRARAQPFANETEWAAFHLVGNPELPRKP
jgi:hypothetical protein